MIKKVESPGFKRIAYNFTGKSWWYITKYLFRVPPRLKLTTNMIMMLDDGTLIVIPDCFITDGASVPRYIWAIPGFSPFGILLDGGIPHDFAFQHGYLLSIHNPLREYTGKDIELKEMYPEEFGQLMPIFVGESEAFFNDMFLEISLFSGATIIPRVAWIGLKIGGSFVWNKYRKHGPGTITENVLGFPGVDKYGYALFPRIN